jgi:hypothetical protein
MLADSPGIALDLPVRHPAYGDMTVEDVFRIIGFHERLHAEEIRRVIDPGLTFSLSEQCAAHA